MLFATIHDKNRVILFLKLIDSDSLEFLYKNSKES